ncbi:MAG: CotH kinase family protein [Acidimicrobiales bacterium]
MIHDVGIKKFLAAFITFLVLAFGASCSSGEANTQKATQNSESPTDSTPLQSDDNSDTSVKSTQETGPDVKESEEEESDAEGEPDVQDGPRYSYGDSDYLFDQEKLHTFELTLSDQNLAYLDSAPALEEYVPGTLTFEGETLPVGIRYKGSVGAWVGCLSGEGFLSTEGEKECTKLSTKIKINWEDSDDTFYEVKKLQFHSQNLDPTKMHERLGYWLFREMGVPAPRSVHARLIINGQFNGIYALTEQIDGRFTRENFDDGTGNLYKEIWPITNSGVPMPAEPLQNALKTNEDEDPTFDIIQQFAQAVVDADGTTRQDVLRQWMNVDQALAYMVVDRAIANDDGVLHFYCGGSEEIEFGGGCNSHNFYWYEDPTAELIHLIPWDLDNAFDNITGPANPVTPIKDKWGEKTNDCKPFAYGQWGLTQLSAACDPIIGTLATLEQDYQELRDAFFAGPFAKETVEGLLNTWAGQIKDAVQEADETHNDQPSMSEWLRAIEKLKGDLEYARNQ